MYAQPWANLISYLTITEKYSWKDIRRAYMDESLDRNILWIIKAHPEFAHIESHDELIDEVFMKQSFDITAVGKKLVPAKLASVI